jgi:hypothetical protein
LFSLVVTGAAAERPETGRSAGTLAVHTASGLVLWAATRFLPVPLGRVGAARRQYKVASRQAGIERAELQLIHLL